MVATLRHLYKRFCKWLCVLLDAVFADELFVLSKKSDFIPEDLADVSSQTGTNK